MATTVERNGRRSLSFWAKRVDELYETVIERTLAQHGLTRGHWRILDALGTGASDLNQLGHVLGPRWQMGERSLPHALADLVRRDWIELGLDDRYSLTTWGEGARLKVARHLRATRDRAAEGLADEDYASAVHVLRQMSENLVRVLTTLVG